MPDYSKRTGYAPWSLTREAGVQSATVNGTIDVPQTCQPTINTGVIDEKGNWQGIKSNDEVFIGITKGEGIADGGEILTPDTNNFPSINMTGFNDLMLAFKVSNGGNYQIKGLMGPDTVPFANLSPVDAGTKLRGTMTINTNFNPLLEDTVEILTADVWEILFVGGGVLANQKNLQIKITNNSGGVSDIEFGFMRLI